MQLSWTSASLHPWIRLRLSVDRREWLSHCLPELDAPSGDRGRGRIGMSTLTVKHRGTAGRCARRSEPHDCWLLERIACRDHDALEQLFARHYPIIVDFFRGLALDAEAVDQLTLDTFLSVWQRASEFDGRASVSGWMMGLGYQRALRSTVQRRESPELRAAERGSANSDLRFDEVSRTDWLRGLGHLPLAQRVVLELTYRFGHSYDEIATIMGCSVPLVVQCALVARRELQALLGSSVAPRHEDAVTVRQGRHS